MSFTGLKGPKERESDTSGIPSNEQAELDLSLLGHTFSWETLGLAFLEARGSFWLHQVPEGAVSCALCHAYLGTRPVFENCDIPTASRPNLTLSMKPSWNAPGPPRPPSQSLTVDLCESGL